MKRIISTALCLLLLFCGSPRLDTPIARAQLAPVAFVLTITAGAVGLVIYIHKKLGEPKAHTFILQHKDQWGVWTSIATNSARLVPEQYFAAFEVWQEQNDKAHAFRIIVLDYMNQYANCGQGGSQYAWPLPVPAEMAP